MDVHGLVNPIPIKGVQGADYASQKKIDIPAALRLTKAAWLLTGPSLFFRGHALMIMGFFGYSI